MYRNVMMVVLALGAAAVLVAASVANATVFYEGFDSAAAGADGWTANGTITWLPTGGVGGTGAIEAADTVHQGINWYAMSDSPPANQITGNINSNYGPGIDFSFDYKLGATSHDTGMAVYIYSGSAGSGSGGWWYKPLTTPGNTPTVWTHYDLRFNTTWTDAQATEAGWKVLASKPGTWADTMTSVDQVSVCRNVDYSVWTAYYYDVYLDNVSMASVPEPTAITLLSIGLWGMVAYGWRKRR